MNKITFASIIILCSATEQCHRIRLCLVVAIYKFVTQLLKLVSLLTIIIKYQRMISISHQNVYVEIKWVKMSRSIWKHSLKILRLTTCREVWTDQ